MQTYIENNLLKRFIVRVGKAHSSFFYFILESNDNLAFYSTLEKSIDEDHRDIEVHATIELEADLKNMIEHFKTRYPLEIILEEIIKE